MSAMEDKWYIIEEFGKIGPFSYRELLGGVERGDYDYSVRLESERTGKRTSLTEVMNRSKRPSSTNRSRTKSIHTNRRKANRRSGSRPKASSVRIEKILKNLIIMLTGSVVALGLFFFFKKVDLSQFLPQQADTQKEPNTVMLDLPSAAGKPVASVFDNVTRISALPKKIKQTVNIGPVRFKRRHLQRCKVKCRLLVNDNHGGSITAVFFAQSFRSKLINARGKIYMRGIVSAKGNELYLQSVSYK